MALTESHICLGFPYLDSITPQPLGFAWSPVVRDIHAIYISVEHVSKSLATQTGQDTELGQFSTLHLLVEFKFWVVLGNQESVIKHAVQNCFKFLQTTIICCPISDVKIISSEVEFHRERITVDEIAMTVSSPLAVGNREGINIFFRRCEFVLNWL